MGREVRRVPVDWEHPRDERGRHIPLFAGNYEAEIADYERERAAYPDDEAAREHAESGGTFEDWHGRPPQPGWYMPAFADAHLGWCIYETVSEGTPVSPVFAEPEALQQWLIGQGYEPEAAARFLVRGWAPSFTTSPGRGLLDGIASS